MIYIPGKYKSNKVPKKKKQLRKELLQRKNHFLFSFVSTNLVKKIHNGNKTVNRVANDCKVKVSKLVAALNDHIKSQI